MAAEMLMNIVDILKELSKYYSVGIKFKNELKELIKVIHRMSVCLNSYCHIENSNLPVRYYS